ncbi:MAG: FtsH protease activity modulator HflK, partial [Solobacterium sp.]|nr:FtsH protease activity modulator HflK [Solobacterium sp.]
MSFISIILWILLFAGMVSVVMAYLANPAKYKGVLQKYKKYYLGAGILLAAVILVSNSFYSVSEDQQAVVTMFGKVIRTDTAGVHFKLPLLQHAEKVDVTTHGASIGYVIENSNQSWGNRENPQMITSDFNLIDVDFYIEYKVNDPVAYLFNSEKPEIILNNEAMASIRAIISDYKVDDVMTTAKGEIQQKIKESMIAKLEDRNIGLQLVNVMIQDVEPPTNEVLSAFKSVETAKQGADTAVNNANRYRNEQLPSAEAEADRIIQAAEASKASRIAEAEGQVSRFNKMYEEYQKYPLITKKRLFFETMEDVLPDLEVV